MQIAVEHMPVEQIVAEGLHFLARIGRGGLTSAICAVVAML